MSFPTAAGIRDMAASTMRYIPSIWSKKLLVKFYAKTVLSGIANTDYEGEIKAMGDTVYIRATPTITIRNYRNGQALVYDQPSATPTSLSIDKGKYWAFSTTVVDEAQTDLKKYTNSWTEAASKDLAVAIDVDVLGNVYSLAHASNYGATAGADSANIDLGVDGGASVALTSATVLTKIVECGQVLDEQSVPEEGRFMVIPPWACSLLKLSDLKNASLTGDSVSVMRNGRLGEIDTFTIYKSRNLATSTDGSAKTCTSIIFGTKAAITFASQLTQNQVIDNPFGFGKLFRGLQVYGYNVVKPEALGWLYARKG